MTERKICSFAVVYLKFKMRTKKRDREKKVRYTKDPCRDTCASSASSTEKDN